MKNRNRCDVHSGFSGADDEARTRYLHLGKVALYQMSYVRVSCTERLLLYQRKNQMSIGNFKKIHFFITGVKEDEKQQNVKNMHVFCPE